MANTGLTNHLCAATKINKRIHKTLEINYNFPSKVYEKSKVQSIDLNTGKLFSWTRAAGRRFHIKITRTHNTQLM